MNQNSNKISFEYEFIRNKENISNKLRKDVPSILSVDALFTIYINEERYFQAEIAILEFYKSLYKWKQEVSIDNISAFHYYTIEYDDYEDGALISVIPFSDKAIVKSIWAELDIYNSFDLHYVVKELEVLEKRLREDIEEYYEITLEKFMKHIPYSH
ncbi:hypothetical protein [Ornithinibacillus xuwenensis]|uniref:DUF7878 domain-containing protein n=1 Tax=Ornithinibacillus xuwenensis TaxID=3144668 RepID=A0ABU9XDD7_9BACI